jgi:RimJ/RimL family protein N-acetyltransferase
VLLRAVEARDLPSIDAGQHDPDVVRWIGPPWPIDEMPARLEQVQADGSPSFAVCESGGSFVGMVWINVREPDRSTGFVGYWLVPAARGRGLATRAVRLISAWAIDALNLRRLRLTAAPDNFLSHRVAERSGFHRLDETTDKGDVIFELDPTDHPRPDRLRR